MTRPIAIARPNFTPTSCDWLVYQAAVHAAPALDVHIRRMQRTRLKLSTMLEERSLNAEQRAELTAILDQLARLGVIYAGEDPDAGRDEGGKFIGDDDGQRTEP